MMWWLGMIMSILFMGIAFTGYSLVLGQMAFWALTVICNLITVLPYGSDIHYFVLGGPSVGYPLLRRCYSIHFLAPFIVTFLTIAHIAYVHTLKSTEEFMLSRTDLIYWQPMGFSFGFKDIYFGCIKSVLSLGVIIYGPCWLMELENYERYRVMVTPHKIVPEWYLLPFYGMLRSIPSKGVGLLVMTSGFLHLVVHAYSRYGIRYSSRYRLKMISWLLLSWILGTVGCSLMIHPITMFSVWLTVILTPLRPLRTPGTPDPRPPEG